MPISAPASQISAVPKPRPAGLTVCGLFAGIGGIELGLSVASHRAEFLCEIDPGAQAVLTRHFSSVPLEPDIRGLAERMDWSEVVTGGFPCQDLSQAGRTAGINGTQSGLIGELFRRIQREQQNPRWLVLENVSFMLHLDHGAGMRYLIARLEDLGFAWAYRVVDTRAFGLPQRRRRVILVASRSEDPRSVLFADDAGEHKPQYQPGLACGFYWTEGTRGLGWAVDAIPTLKGGSTIGIPSAPAIWMPDGSIVTPDIRDAERLQGFDSDWTLPAVIKGSARSGQRWKLIGNAVSVPVFVWVGQRLAHPGNYVRIIDEPLASNSPWPQAAWGAGGKAYGVRVSMFPVREPYHHLMDFLEHRPRPLSLKATAGFLQRAEASRLRFVEGFLDSVRAHLARMREADPSQSARAH